MTDELSHDHSDSAYEILDEFLVGVLSTSKPSSLADTDASTLVDPEFTTKVVDDRGEVYATGLSCEEDLNVPTNITADYAKHKFLDLGRPLLPQVFCGGFSKEFYLSQVHRPRHYPGGSAPLMPFAWMEPLSKTPWWMVPILWIPGVIYGTYLAKQGLSTPYVLCFGCVLMVVRWLGFGFLDCFCGLWWSMGCIDSYSMSMNGYQITDIFSPFTLLSMEFIITSPPIGTFLLLCVF
jgi:4-hydroxysphinganine ceramide fatty acyl 2-hydroxylase